MPLNRTIEVYNEKIRAGCPCMEAPPYNDPFALSDTSKGFIEMKWSIEHNIRQNEQQEAKGTGSSVNPLRSENNNRTSMLN